MKVKQKKSALLPGLITVLMVVAAVAGGLRMIDPDGGRLDTMRQELETITAENEGLTAQVEALRTETAEQKALPEAIQKQKDEGFRLLGELERQIRAGESDKRIAYLTFDDGPYDNTTDAILDILKEKGVHATFFLRHRPDHVAQIQREIREGHTLANHSYSHKIKAVYQSADSCIKEIRDQQKWLTETVGVTPEIYRFPGGSPTAGNKKQAIAAALVAALRLDMLAEKAMDYYDQERRTVCYLYLESELDEKYSHQPAEKDFYSSFTVPVGESYTHTLELLREWGLEGYLIPAEWDSMFVTAWGCDVVGTGRVILPLWYGVETEIFSQAAYEAGILLSREEAEPLLALADWTYPNTGSDDCLYLSFVRTAADGTKIYGLPMFLPLEEARRQPLLREYMAEQYGEKLSTPETVDVEALEAR